ncbi:MAG TPA: cytochrome c [Candidatus Aquabacterium excrementipullorum]|nr:cytochrome c [Candidatus Aquabacterium excrementipullorum]
MSSKARHRRLFMALLLIALVGIATATVWSLNRLDESPLPAQDGPSPTTEAQIARGAYLARAGNCATCHTERGGAPYAGGRALATPFGTVYSSNLTPDEATGLGRWSAEAFWRALHNGRSRDGRLLYPVFPYPNYTQVTRADSDALYAYLRSLPPAKAPNRAHELSFPISTQPALAVWRALYFRPGVHRDEPGRTAEWNRGAYLVRGLGHCAACHEARNLLGASQGLELAGGLMPLQNWYAPSLRDPREAGVADWPGQDIVTLLRTGLAPRGGVLGPMADVVYRSTQHLSEPDLHAMAVFLKSLPPPPVMPSEPTHPTDVRLAQGAALYDRHCATCHGEQGEGVPGIYPALAGNRAVRMAEPANVIRVIAKGGFLPATQGNPRPFGMPPFAHQLSDDDIAAVATYVRHSWGNRAGLVEPQTVGRLRAGGDD